MLPSLISESLTPGASLCCGEHAPGPAAAWSPGAGAGPPPGAVAAGPPGPPLDVGVPAVAPLRVPAAVVAPAPFPAPRASTYCCEFNRAPQATVASSAVAAANITTRCRTIPL